MSQRRFWSVFPASTREATDAIVANLLLHWFPARMRVTSLAWTPSLWLGTVSWVLFVSLLLTGLPLMVFYIPSTRDAYASMKDIEHAVSFGWWLRAAHRVGAHMMVIAVTLHMARVFLTGSYRNARRPRAAPRVELGDRRGHADRHRAAVVHRLPAAVGPARLLGDHRQHEHRGVGAPCRRRAARACCSAGARWARPPSCASTCCTSSCCQSRWRRCSAITCGGSGRTAAWPLRFPTRPWS